MDKSLASVSLTAPAARSALSEKEAAVDAALLQKWDPDKYARNARFVADLAMPVVDLLAPVPGERILDVGCGDGFLTAKLAALGCRVLGVDASAAQVEGARKLGLEVLVRDAAALDFPAEFDAVFTNATLHWVRDHDAAIDGAWLGLKPGGRFVGECGGEGCVLEIRKALGRALARRGVDIDAVNPWNFSSAGEFRRRLEARGFTVESAVVFPRPTPLPGDVRAWLETFAEHFMSTLPPESRGGFLDEVQEDLRPVLCDQEGKWTADYTRLRFRAIKP